MHKVTRLSVMVFLVYVADGSRFIHAQVQEKNTKDHTIPDPALVARGKYIVEGVAMCERCHTQRDEHGNPDRAHWLMGGPTQTQPTYPSPAWAIREPRIAGAPPGTDAEFVRLLTTGISRTGRPPNPPMPPFRMTREDAEAVLSYLKSLR
jgi:mono/diheme cytochrome c family protein